MTLTPRTPARRPLRPMTVAVLALAAALPAAQAAERSLDKEATVNAPVDAVWQAWTTREGVTSFFAPDGRVEARPDGAFELYFDPGAAPGDRGADGMRFLALQPPRMLSFTWNAPPSLPEARQQRTAVVVRLTPLSATQTKVTLHHTGWGDGGEWDRAYAYLDKAWSAVLGNLQKRFDSGPIDWKPWLERLEQARAVKPRS